MPEPTVNRRTNMKKFQALGSVLALALAGTIVTVPAMARTHHPSTSGERAQTRDLNMQQLAIAQGQAPANQQAMNGAAQPQNQNMNQNQNVPADQMTNGGQTAQAPSNTQSAPAPEQKPQTPAPSTPSGY
jgi:hypothetical protein